MDKSFDDPGAGVPPGADRYIAGAPFTGFADGENRTWFPLMGLTVNEPLTDLLPTE